MLRKLLLSSLLFCLFTQSHALELGIDLNNAYVEGSLGNTTYNTPESFLFEGDNYDSPVSLNVLAGVHFNNNYSENHFIAAETFFQYFGKVDDSRIIEGAKSSADLTTYAFGGGLKFARALRPDIHLYTRFGLHSWFVTGDRTVAGFKANNCCKEDGIDTYAGLGVSALMYNRIIVKGEFTAFPIDLEGENFHLKVFALGAGIYF